MSSSRRFKQCGKEDCKNKIKTLENKLVCERCNLEFHLDCSDFNAEAYQIMKNDNSLDQMIWCCSKCRPQVRNFLENIEEVQNKLNNVDKKVDDLKETFEQRFKLIETNLNQKQCTNEDKIKNMEINFTNNVKSNKESLNRVITLEEKINIQNEQSDKEKRVKNIILYNIPESLSETANERIADDCQKLKNIFESKNLTLDPEKIDSIFRLGKRQESTTEESNVKPRPLLIKFTSLEYKKGVIKFCKFLCYINDGEKLMSIIPMTLQ